MLITMLFFIFPKNEIDFWKDHEKIQYKCLFSIHFSQPLKRKRSESILSRAKMWIASLQGINEQNSDRY